MTDSSARMEEISSETEGRIARTKQRSAGTKEIFTGTREGVSGARETGWKMKKGDLELVPKAEIDGGCWFPTSLKLDKTFFEQFNVRIEPQF